MTASRLIPALAVALLALPVSLGRVHAGEVTEAEACQTQLDELGASLRGAPTGAIGRPGQPPIKLDNGKWYPVSEIDSIRQELHRAARLCREGKTHEGLNELNLVRRHLDLAALPHPESHGIQK